MTRDQWTVDDLRGDWKHSLSKVVGIGPRVQDLAGEVIMTERISSVVQGNPNQEYGLKAQSQ